MAQRLVSVDDNYLFPTPLEVRLATKMAAAVTDSAVASRVNEAQTGAAIDARITTKATPLVQPIVADYIASSQVVVDAAAAAVDANPKIATLEQKNTSQDTAITAAKTEAIADSTTKYGGLPTRVTAIETKKCVRLEAGRWVWDTVNGTHYVIPDADGALVVRATAIPIPAATPALNW